MDSCSWPVDIGCGAQEIIANCDDEDYDEAGTWSVVEPTCSDGGAGGSGGAGGLGGAGGS